MIRLAIALVLLAGCASREEGAPCARHSDCASGVCGRDGKCASATEPTPDAGEPDASTSIPPFDAGDLPDAEGL